MSASTGIPDAAPPGASARYPHVFRPLEIGSLTLRNRVFVSAHTTNFGESFLPTGRHVDYHRERARGGAGLIITEPLRVHTTSLGRAGGLGASADGLDRLVELTTAVRDEGAAVFTQITHAGRHSDNSFLRTASWGPSAQPFDMTGPVPHAMSRNDIREVRRAYVDAALLARQAGFQGVEVHFGHGHLLHQFISPASNTRTDEYGGDEQDRMRFPMEVLHAVLDAVGSDLVVGVRMSADELLAGGQDLEAGRRIAASVDATDGVGFLNVSIASYTVPSIGHHVADMSEGRTPYLQQTMVVARECRRLPVLAACRVVDLGDAERVLSQGPIAAVAMTRAHIADPHLVRNALNGVEHETRPCVSCNYCIEQIGRHRPLTCMMNPTVGREAEWPLVPERAPEPRRVVVVGGGPAGLEAARVAAQRGHDVEVWEREARLGGQVRIGRKGIGRHELDLLRAYEERQLADLGVRVRTRVEATPETVAAADPDAVVIATGARHRRRHLPGWGPALTVRQVLDRRDWSASVVVVVDESGSWTALSVAETVAARGGRVHVVTPSSAPLWGVTEYSRMVAIERLRSLGVDLHTSSVATFDGRVVSVQARLSSVTTTLDGVTDVTVVAHPAAVDALVDPLRDSGITTHVVGDAMAPRSLLDAMFEGHAAGRSL